MGRAIHSGLKRAMQEMSLPVLAGPARIKSTSLANPNKTVEDWNPAYWEFGRILSAKNPSNQDLERLAIAYQGANPGDKARLDNYLLRCDLKPLEDILKDLHSK